GPGQEALQGPEIVAHLLAGGPPHHDAALAVAQRETARRPTLESWELLARVHHARGDSERAAEAEAALAAIRTRLARLSAPSPGS
ncbi:MAG: hypothetical protein M3N43_04760, partial [Actinomycetota bacterium]|nr:hypothetical protein [Actinomycetota bacterium]